jgi:hypothetical protein
VFSAQQRNSFLFFEQVFSGGFAAIRAERLCLSGATEKTLRLRRRGGASIESQIDGKPEAFRKGSGKAAYLVFGCGSAALRLRVESSIET